MACVLCVQKRFPCRSAEYEYGSMRCALSDSDRRTAQHFVQLVDTPGTDYFEVSPLNRSRHDQLTSNLNEVLEN